MPVDPPESGFRTPRIYAEINGETINSVMHAEMTASGSCKCSRFQLTVGIQSNSPAGQWLNLLRGLVSVDIYARARATETDVPLFRGLVDNVTVDPINALVRLAGRDYSAILASSTYQDSFVNRTASEIAAYVADRHGFGSNIMATTTMAGSYQCDGYNQLVLNAHAMITTEWDLLVRLARREGFELYFDGSILVFAPATSLSHRAMGIDAQSVTSIRFRANFSTSRRTTLAVKSWNSWLARSVLYSSARPTAASGFSESGFNSGVDAELAMVRPNLSPDDAASLAARQMTALDEQALTVQIVMPGEELLSPLDVLTITGFGDGFDNAYTVASVHRRFSSISGFTQHVEAFAGG